MVGQTGIENGFVLPREVGGSGAEIISYVEEDTSTNFSITMEVNDTDNPPRKGVSKWLASGSTWGRGRRT